MTYLDFLSAKRAKAATEGTTVDPETLHPRLFDWQREIVSWAVGVGRAAIWADTGLGKTMMQLEWAKHSGATALIVAPLAVCQQTVREAARIDLSARYITSGDQIDGPGIYVTNYERVDQIDPRVLDAVVLDEASILKNSSGKMRELLIAHFQGVPARLACTATPAPNDPEELTNQAEFLGQMKRNLMLAAYFVHDQDGWRLKGHARRPMLQWMATWALAIRLPSDMGGDDTGYILPGLKIAPELIHVEVEAEGQLFATELGGVSGRSQIRKQTLEARCERAAELIRGEPDEPWLIWTGMNAEADLIAKLIPGAVNVHGSLSPDEKADALLGFADGRIQHLITKPQIASQGLNYQHCARMVFVGLSDSYEQYYQAIRRCYRYGQTRVVDAHIVLSEIEAQIATNVRRKEAQAADFTTSLVAEMQRARAEKELIA